MLVNHELSGFVRRAKSAASIMPLLDFGMQGHFYSWGHKTGSGKTAEAFLRQQMWHNRPDYCATTGFPVDCGGSSV